MATSECDSGRQVKTEFLHPYNLKIENNLREYFLVVIGVKNDQFLFENLPRIINPDCIKSFDDVDTSLAFICLQGDVNVFVIQSGQLGRQHARQLIDMPQIVAIYVYCMNENEHKSWSKGMNKIRCTVSKLEELLKELHRGIKELNGRWPLDESSFQKAATSNTNWYHLFLTVVCYRSEHIDQSYEEMFKESRAYYQNNRSMAKEIDRVQQTYKSNKAVQEYTKNSFIYRIINHALRTKNMQIVRKFSPFIRDLNSQIHELHRSYYKSKQNDIRVVYRGQYLTADELQYLRSISKSNNTVITTTTFTSASLDPEVALNFIPSFHGRISCLFEIVIPGHYNIGQEYQPSYKQAFANITSLSVHSDEQEVLFSLMTHFHLRHIGEEVYESERTWLPIQLELTREDIRGASHLFIVREWMEKEKDSNSYNEAIDVLEENARNEFKFQSTNWQNWWNRLKRDYGKGFDGEQQPINLIFYDCFTEDPFWSRKAIDAHKTRLKNDKDIQSNLSSFQSLYTQFKVWNAHPTIAIAIYEDYLEAFCHEDSSKVLACLCSVAEHYRNISDHERAFKCYEKASQLNANDKYQKKEHIEKQMKQLHQSSKKKVEIDCPKPQSVRRQLNQCIAEKTEKREDLQFLYEPINSEDITNFPVEIFLQRIYRYIETRERYYDTLASRILLGIPYEINKDFSVNDYRSHFLSAVLTHISLGSFKTNAANHRSLSFWRYREYLSQWMLCKELEKFFQPFQQKLAFIGRNILPRLQRLLKKLLVLITIVIVYMSVRQTTGRVNINSILAINPTMLHPISTDLEKSALKFALLDLQDKGPHVGQTSDMIPDNQRLCHLMDESIL